MASTEEIVVKPKLAVWKFASCDGCQLSILDCEDELLTVVANVDIAYFPEASREMKKGPYDVSLVEGSVTTAHDRERIQEIREMSKVLISIGACATAGGIQALRNFKDVNNFISLVYAHPEYINTLDQSTPISDHIKVDFELRGCPINKYQLLEVIAALLQQRKPNISAQSVCMECKLKGNICVLVSQGTPCLGPVTHSGCDALCPDYNRGCFGCYGPKETANADALGEKFKAMGATDSETQRFFQTFNAWAEPFRNVK